MCVCVCVRQYIDDIHHEYLGSKYVMMFENVYRLCFADHSIY